MITGILLLTMISRPKKHTTYLSCLIIFVCIRLIRGWNNAGHKTAYSYVIGNLLDVHPSVKWGLNCVTVFWLSISSRYDILSPLAQIIIPIIILAYKINWTIVDKENIPIILEDLVKFNVKYLSREDNEIPFGKALIPTALIIYKLFFILILLRISLLLVKKSNPTTFVTGLFRDITIFLIYLSPARNIPQYLLFDIIRRCTTQILQEEFKS